MLDNKADIKRTLLTWVIISVIVGVAGYPLTFLMPLNKKIYSTSYLFLTIGVAGLTLSFLVIVVDLVGKSNQIYQKVVKVVTFPFVWLGRNPLAVFVVMNLASSFM